MSENMEKMTLEELLAFFKDNMSSNIYSIREKTDPLHMSKNITFFFNNWMKQFNGYIEEIKKRVIK